MLGPGRVDVGAGSLRPTDLKGNGDDLEPLRMQLGSQRLPPGQVPGTTSVGCPRDQHHFLAPERGQTEFVTVKIGQHQLRCFGRYEGPLTEGFGADRPQAGAVVGDDGHAKAFRGRQQVETGAPEGHTCIGLARPFRFY